LRRCLETKSDGADVTSGGIGRYSVGAENWKGQSADVVRRRDGNVSQLEKADLNHCRVHRRHHSWPRRRRTRRLSDVSFADLRVSSNLPVA